MLQKNQACCSNVLQPVVVVVLLLLPQCGCASILG
jgi:hypothetical protein